MRYPFQAFGRVKPSTVLTKDIIGVFSVFYIHRSTFKQNSLTSLPLKGWLERLSLACPLQTRQPWALTIVLTLITYISFLQGTYKCQPSTPNLSIPVIHQSVLRVQYHFRFVPRT